LQSYQPAAAKISRTDRQSETHILYFFALFFGGDLDDDEEEEEEQEEEEDDDDEEANNRDLCDGDGGGSVKST
jgi:hypothetical protein